MPFFRTDRGKNTAAARFRHIKDNLANADHFPVVFFPCRSTRDHDIGAELFNLHPRRAALLQIAQRSVIHQQIRETIGKRERHARVAFNPPGQLWSHPTQLHAAGEEAAKPLINRIGGDSRGKMVAPDFRRRILGGKISKPHQRAAAVRRGQMQAIVQGRGGKAHHLWKLTRCDEGAIGFGNHKNTIKSQTADVCQSVGQPNATH